jgi:perosamine synthetase
MPFGKPYFSDDSRKKITQGVDKILSSGQLMLGEFTEKFEKGFAEYTGTSYAITTNSCTTALQIALMHFDVTDCEVLIPAAGFLTDLSVVRWAGGIPVLVDIDPATLSFDLDDLNSKLSPKTKGIIWVHLTGIIAENWREIKSFADSNNLFLIEDCAHAHGATIEGMKAGSIGDVGCFSFYPTKVMTTGTGGLLTTNDPELTKSARELRLFGRENGNGSVIREGNDWFMDEIRACIGFYQLAELEQGLSERRRVADRYIKGLKDVEGLTLLDVKKENHPSWYHFTAFVDLSIDYNKLVKVLNDEYGVPTKQIYVPLHKEPIFSDFDTDNLPNTEMVLNYSLCLPLYVGMESIQVEYVISSIKAALIDCTSNL